MSTPDPFLRELESQLSAPSAEDEVTAFLGAPAAGATKAIQADREARQADAAIVDLDPAAFPMDPLPTVVRAMRHALAVSGFTAAEPDEILDNPPGSADAVAAGRDVADCELGRRFTDFITLTRSVVLTYPGRPVRDWWTTARHGKRLTPLDLLKQGRQRDRIFQPYGAELHCNGQVVSQLLPTLGTRSHLVELAIKFQDPSA